jgi:alkylated DNA repair dioxygenase AlkB
MLQQQCIIRRRIRQSSEDKKWSSWTGNLQRMKKKARIYYDFKDGGQLVIHPNFLTETWQKQISNEIIASNWFRQYQVQNNNEPRIHFLLHENGAIDNLDFKEKAQPGYKYGSVYMKARAFDASVFYTRQLSIRAQKLCQTCCTGMSASTGIFWNIGADCIIYRDGNDQINYHADNDQGEQIIFTVLVSSPTGCTRKIRIRNKDLSEEIELFLDAGDAYSMNEEMQKNYLHSVPQDKKCTSSSLKDTSQQRIVVVLRRGNQVMQKKDSGKSVFHLFPRKFQPYIFGRLDNLSEGHTYSRTELITLHAHR